MQLLVKELLKHNFGLVGEKAKISDVRSSQPGMERNEPCGDCFGDRFQLTIPYAGMDLNWDVVFNSSALDCPPDFDFNNEAFTNYITIECLGQTVPSLLYWQPNDRYALKNVVSELLQLFKKYQVDQLKEMPPYGNYENAIESGLMTPDDAEVYVDITGAITFLFRLSLDMSDFDVQDADNEYALLVSLYFSRPSAKMSKLQVEMTPALLDVTNARQFNQKHESTCSESTDLADFLRRVVYKVSTSILHHKVKPLTKRKRFILEFLNVRGASVLEFDAMDFNHASFLLDDSKGFFCILKVTLTNNYPVTAPVYTLRSVYNTGAVTVLDRIPFQISWDNRLAIKRALDFIEKEMNAMKSVR